MAKHSAQQNQVLRVFPEVQLCWAQGSASLPQREECALFRQFQPKSVFIKFDV